MQRGHGRGPALPKSPAGPPGPLPTRTRCVCSRCRWGYPESRGMSGGEITDLHNFAGLRWSREVSTAARSLVPGVPNTPRGFSRSGLAVRRAALWSPLLLRGCSSAESDTGRGRGAADGPDPARIQRTQVRGLRRTRAAVQKHAVHRPGGPSHVRTHVCTGKRAA